MSPAGKKSSGSGCSTLILLALLAAGAGGGYLYFRGGEVLQKEASDPGPAAGVPAAGPAAPTPSPAAGAVPAGSPAAPGSAMLRLSDEEKKYLEWVEALKAASRDQNVPDPRMKWAAGGIGSISGQIRLVQIVGEDMALVESVGGAGGPGMFLLTPAPLDKKDGSLFSLDRAVCVYRGKKTYSSIFGDSSTRDLVEVLDAGLIEWAGGFAERQQRLDAEKQVLTQAWIEEYRQARQQYQETRTRLAELRAGNQKLETYARAQEDLRLYGNLPSPNVQVKLKIAEAQETLEKLKDVKASDVAQYEAQRQTLARQLQDAARQLAQVSRKQPQ